jgi:hypothetical protein
LSQNSVPAPQMNVCSVMLNPLFGPSLTRKVVGIVSCPSGLVMPVQLA